jgi:hypothetical protein
MTRLGNDIKVFFADMLQGLTDSSERIGSVLAQTDGLFKLLDGLAKASRGNFLPLFEVLGTARTIAEMEEIEARATAIAQLTREGAFGMDALRNAEIIAERTKQVLENVRGTKAQLDLSEDTTTELVRLESDKADQIDRQNAAMERQEQQRKDAIRSMEAEIALMEAKLTGNKELEESLRQQADFQAALQKTDSFETAANFSATKAAERAAQTSEAAAGASTPSAPGEFTQPDRPPTQDQRVAQMRAAAAAERTMGRAGEFQAGGMFNSAVNRQMASERAAARVMDRQANRDLAAQFDFAGREAGNLGEAMKSVIDEVGKMGEGGFLGRISKAKGFNPKAGDDKNFLNALKKGAFDDLRDFDPDNEMKRFTDDAAKTEAERKREEESMKDKTRPPAQQQDDATHAIYNWLENTFFGEFKKRLPQVALG